VSTLPVLEEADRTLTSAVVYIVCVFAACATEPMTAGATTLIPEVRAMVAAAPRTERLGRITV